MTDIILDMKTIFSPYEHWTRRKKCIQNSINRYGFSPIYYIIYSWWLHLSSIWITCYFCSHNISKKKKSVYFLHLHKFSCRILVITFFGCLSPTFQSQSRKKCQPYRVSIESFYNVKKGRSEDQNFLIMKHWFSILLQN